MVGFNTRSILSSQRGFTLIELIVVIGILGILAVGLLATIDPLEQFRKGTDQTRKDGATTLSSAILRYYGTRSVYPWDENASDTCSQPGSNNSGADGTTMATFEPCLDILIRDGELKSTFKDNGDIMQNIQITYRIPTQQQPGLFICFQPQSKTVKTSTETKYWRSGYLQPACPSTSVSTCAWCMVQ